MASALLRINTDKKVETNQYLRTDVSPLLPVSSLDDKLAKYDNNGT